MKARIAAVSLVSAALVAGAAGAAGAAPAHTPAPRPSISLFADSVHVKRDHGVVFAGRTTGLREGSRVTLQVKDGRHWRSLPVTTTVRHSAYKLSDKFRKRGFDTVRVVDGRTASRPVTVEVR
ncbi:hypothetical protein [Streptomyces sp. NPDC086777]|uniref:hypothetical protein n=1 Tax=Streptomyces sp. NPDC086777 TaxID=3154866 RepID=UPI00344C4556